MNFWTAVRIDDSIACDASTCSCDRPRPKRRVHNAFAVGALSAIALGGCHMHAEEPRQRQDFSDSPVQYGETRFSGMALPGAATDAGPPAAR
jgi:hypothetical protein